MQIKVGSEIKIGAKKRMIIEIQTDAFDWKQNEISFDDKSKVLQGDLVRKYNEELSQERWVQEKAREHSIECATIPKKDLVDGAIYKGFCRNSEYAIWCAAYDQFEYRWKQGCQEITDYIKHPEDEKRYDVFTPFEKVSDGMIPKKDLVVGATYIGHCRNACDAVWLGDKFEYVREKFGNKFKETISHPEDDNGYDVFVPTLKLDDIGARGLT